MVVKIEKRFFFGGFDHVGTICVITMGARDIPL